LKLPLFILFIFIVMSCNSESEMNIPANDLPIYNITLEPGITYGETDSLLIGRMLQDIVIDHLGRVYIADLIRNTIYIYNPDGSFLQSVGRDGRGPGEFKGIAQMQITESELHVFDSSQSKISIYELNTFEHVTDISLSRDVIQNENPPWLSDTRERRLNYRVTHFYIRSDGTYLLVFSDAAVGTTTNLDSRTYEFSIFNPEEKKFIEHDLLSIPWTGRILHAPESSFLMFFVPYKRNSEFDFANGLLVQGWTEESELQIFSEDGEFKRAIQFQFENAPLNLNELIQSYYPNASERLTRAFRNDATLPVTMPAFSTLKVDDERRIWVAAIIDDYSSYKWLVLSELGEFYASFVWPRNRILLKINDGYAYVMERHPDSDIQFVVRYELSFEI